MCEENPLLQPAYAKPSGLQYFQGSESSSAAHREFLLIPQEVTKHFPVLPRVYLPVFPPAAFLQKSYSALPFPGRS